MKVHRNLMLLAAVLALGSCEDAVDPSESDNPFGSDPVNSRVSRVYLTDAPLAGARVQSVNVHIVSIALSEIADTMTADQDWVTAAEPRRTFDLLTLRDGQTALLGERELPTGDYRAVRVIIDTDLSSVILYDGATASVSWPLEGELTMFARVEKVLSVPEEGMDIVIDFDAGRSLAEDGSGFAFLPWLRAVNSTATGTIAGTVSGRRSNGGQLEPLEGVAVTAFEGDTLTPRDQWVVAATGQTGPDGSYSVTFLPEDVYIVEFDASSIQGFSKEIVSGVRVVSGQVTTLDMVLVEEVTGAGIIIEGNLDVVVDESSGLRATVFDDNGDPVPDPEVTWTSADPSIATVVRDDSASAGDPNASYALLTGVTEGSTTITAAANGLSQTVDVTVSSGGSGETLSIEGDFEVGVNGTSAIRATVFDADGNPVPDLDFTWTSADPSIATVREDSASAGDPFVSHALLTGVSEGTTSVTASAMGLSETVDVTVSGDGSAPVYTVTVSPASQTVSVGDSTTVYATLKDIDGNVLTGRTISWSVSDSSVVEVQAFGPSAILWALAPGTTTVTATSEGKSGSASVTVQE